MVYFNISNDHNLDSSIALESKMDKVKNNENIKDLYKQLNPNIKKNIVNLKTKLSNLELYYLMYFKKFNVILISKSDFYTYSIF